MVHVTQAWDDDGEIRAFIKDLLTFVPHAVRIGLVCAKGVRSALDGHSAPGVPGANRSSDDRSEA